jgi:hypothetical protein
MSVKLILKRILKDHFRRVSVIPDLPAGQAGLIRNPELFMCDCSRIFQIHGWIPASAGMTEKRFSECFPDTKENIT